MVICTVNAYQIVCKRCAGLTLYRTHMWYSCKMDDGQGHILQNEAEVGFSRKVAWWECHRGTQLLCLQEHRRWYGLLKF